MNILTSNPTAAQQVARQTIDDRVRDAEQRRLARAARAERRTVYNPQGRPSPTPPLPWWSMRFLRPAH
jgi:hypothetical protein